MDQRYSSIRKHYLAYLFLLSLLLHFVFLLFVVHWGKWFHVQPTAQKEYASDSNLVFEIIETPEDSQIDEQNQRTRLVSDKQSGARDLHNEQLEDNTLPFSRGITAVKNLLKTQPGLYPEKRRSPSMPAGASDLSDKAQIPVKTTSRSFSRDQLFRRSTRPASRAENSAVYDQQHSSADQSGGISFNTYNWEFGPYLLELKRRIQKHIYPPPAFTHLGFGGKNVLKFRINPDGSLEEPVILDYQGEKALMETSINAILLSAPFWPLPDHFPEPYLEVTANFDYIIRY